MTANGPTMRAIDNQTLRDLPRSRAISVARERTRENRGTNFGRVAGASRKSPENLQIQSRDLKL